MHEGLKDLLKIVVQVEQRKEEIINLFLKMRND